MLSNLWMTLSSVKGLLHHARGEAMWRDVSVAIDWVARKSRCFYTMVRVRLAPPANGSQRHLAVQARMTENYCMRGSILSDNSPMGVLVFLGFATRVINVLARETRAMAHKISHGVKTKASSCEQVSRRLASRRAWCKRTFNHFGDEAGTFQN